MAWIPVGVIILGFFPMLMVWLKLWLTRRSIARAETTSGIIESVEQRIGHKGNRFYVATINYLAGKELIRVGHVLSHYNRNKLKAGQQVVVLYNPKKPKKFHLRDYPFNFRTAWIFTGIIALAYFVLAYFLYREFKL